ncbi:MAG TPA: rod shape-determining protein MreC [bacterium]|nr:rod shape-determining protein MreC [bacterium]
MSDVPGFVHRHRKGVTFTLLLALCLLLIMFTNQNVILKPKQFGQSLFSGLQIAVKAGTSWFRNTWNSVGELKKLRKELDKSREKLLEYEQLSRNLTELRRENSSLREQLDFSETLPYRLIAAVVIGRDPGNDFSTIMVNKGSKDGVKKGMPVVAFQGGLQGLVGKVVLTSLATSILKPITDPTSYVAARLQHSRYDGLVRGRQMNEGSLLMQYVKKRAVNEIQYGELIISSGLGQVYPQGVHLGRVREIRSKPYESSIELEIEPIIDFSRLEYVHILTEE